MREFKGLTPWLAISRMAWLLLKIEIKKRRRGKGLVKKKEGLIKLKKSLQV